ncbi:hypothetical protein ACFSQQ_01220 [Mesorhizobium kowhaii]|uniref:Uncharacterized protein n=2 Tax=Mesorhizobium TaxID=68287 RepID=A0ABW4WAN3_9HYPH|nr:hypothetical protein [Mesorhizobium sophorae]
MRKQTKPFIIEVKPSRKPKSGPRKTSIWGQLDLRTEDDPPAGAAPQKVPAAIEDSAAAGGR